MKTFESIKSKLEAKGIPFDVVSFTDDAVSARTLDTSINHNYKPENAIKTLTVSTKGGYKAVILRGSDHINQQKLKTIVGKWDIADKDTLESKFGYSPGTICPLDLDLPVFVDEAVKSIDVWSMGAGATNKGLNISCDVMMGNLDNYQIVSIKQ